MSFQASFQSGETNLPPAPAITRWIAGFLLAGWSALLLEISEPMVKRLFEAGFLCALWFGYRNLCNRAQASFGKGSCKHWRTNVAELHLPFVLKTALLLMGYAIIQTLFLPTAGHMGDAVKTGLWFGLFLYAHAVALRYFGFQRGLTITALTMLALKSLWIILAIALGYATIPYEGQKLLENSNYVGGILAALWVFCAAKLLEPPFRAQSLLIGAMILFSGFFSLLLVGSRGALLALIITTFALVLYRTPRHWRIAVMAVSTMGLLLLLFSISQLLPDQWQQWVERLDSFRFFLWEEAWRIWHQQPLWGLGWGAHFDVTLPYGAPAIHPHNMFIGGFVYGGILGGVLLLILYAAMGWQLTRNPRDHAAFLPLWGYAMVLGMVDYGFWLPEFSVQWFWCWLPLAHLWQYHKTK